MKLPKSFRGKHAYQHSVGSFFFLIGILGSLSFALPVVPTVGFEVLAQAATRLTDQQSPQPAPPPYLVRGEEIAARYQNYTAQLATFHEQLRLQLAADAPDLLPRLTKEPPKPQPFGYQLVPRLVPSQPPAGVPPRIVSTSFSWPRTERMLSDQLRLFDGSQRQLLGVSSAPVNQRHDLYDRIVDNYLKGEKAQRVIDRHLKHNRFWQNEIHGHKVRFDRQTTLHDAVLEHQSLQDSLISQPPSDQVRMLRKRDQELEDYIQTHRESEPAASFIHVEERSPQLWIFHVPVFSDIQNLSFLEACKETIETGWHIVTRDREFRVEVDLHTINPVDLYLPNVPPSMESHIDPRNHVSRFPAEGGVLTTGAKSTHAIPRRAVILGPHDIGTNTLVHEFGHILGFTDRYFRGYRDLGDDGYEILEVVPDYEDIMASPGWGNVQRSHFEALLANHHSEEN